ncbi:MAG: hypothetical protein ABSD53_09720 [Terriglobales bacterium]|jgi:hypothetical protein
MGEAKRRRKVGLEPRPPFRVRAAAFHEAAHVLAGFHWDVPILEVYVQQQGSDAMGFTDAQWSQLEPTKAAWYGNRISQLAGPIADLQHRLDAGCDADEVEACLISCYDDFRDIMGRHGVTPEEGIRFGRACFLLFLGMESEVKVLNQETATFTKTLVMDTTALVTAYAAQIANLADAILAAPDMKLSESAVNKWRDRSFEKVGLTLQGE